MIGSVSWEEQGTLSMQSYTWLVQPKTYSVQGCVFSSSVSMQKITAFIDCMKMYHEGCKSTIPFILVQSKYFKKKPAVFGSQGSF